MMYTIKISTSDNQSFSLDVTVYQLLIEFRLTIQTVTGRRIVELLLPSKQDD